MENPIATAGRVMDWCRELLPFWVEGDCLWCVNRAADGWVVGLFNGKGIDRDAELNVVREADATARVRIAGAGSAVCVAASAPAPEIRTASGGVEVDVEPGGYLILRLR